MTKKIVNHFCFWLTLVVFTVSVSAQTGSVKTAGPKSDLFDAAQLISDIKTLSADDMEGRAPELPSIKKTRELVERRFRESGIKSFGKSYRQEFSIKHKVSPQPIVGVNFVGQITGSKPDRHIIITAHYDHDGIRDGQIYNGADDNSSGTAALFAIADYFSRNRPQHTLIFVAFDAEEMGLLGSKHFVANLPVKKASVLLNVNMDMISRNDKGELWATGAFHNPWLKPILEAAQKKATVELMLGHDDPKLGRDDWTFQSDHASFHREKIPFIYFGVEDHPDYHKPTDDFEKVNQDFYVRAVETIINAVRELDKQQLEKQPKN